MGIMGEFADEQQINTTQVLFQQWATPKSHEG